MSQRTTINVPLNRVEGDLEIRADMEDGVVTDAWCSGTMYRGFENLLIGRGALDGLVITPRVCGICSTGHLLAAVRALDMMAHVSPPPNALRVRNATLMAEQLQSDVRHTFLMFAPDLTNPAYKDLAQYADAVCRYQPFRGETVLEVIRETKRLIEVIAILGGQWPHSSFMVPGGVTSIPSAADLLQCQLLLRQFRGWYERRILGCSVERWLQVRSSADLDAWLSECEAHRVGDLGFFLQFARAIGLDRVGRGPAAFISFGSFDLPADSGLCASHGGGQLVPAGFAQGVDVREFDQTLIAEHAAHSWYVDDGGGRHPSAGETRPWGPGMHEQKYSWAKAPRYGGAPAETGPLAEMVVAGHPLFADLMSRGGPSVLVRQLARLVRPCQLMPALETWLAEATAVGEFFAPSPAITDGEGFGLTQVSRGALGHWVRIEDRTIRHYQMITPTAWNASPRDGNGVRGPIEQALIGVRVQDLSNPVELGHVVRSFDPCLVCTVHTVQRKATVGRLTVGALP